jgi:hypothetical protein
MNWVKEDRQQLTAKLPGVFRAIVQHHPAMPSSMKIRSKIPRPLKLTGLLDV